LAILNWLKKERKNKKFGKKAYHQYPHFEGLADKSKISLIVVFG